MKNLKRNLSRAVKCGAAVALLLSLGAVSTVGSARRVHYRPRVARRLIHHRRFRGGLRLRRRKSVKRSRRQSRAQIRWNSAEVYHQTVRDINRDRQRYRLPELKVSRKLSRIGTVRSRQLQRYFSHNTRWHRDEVQFLLNQRHVQYEYYGENIASSPLGTIYSLEVGPYNSPTDAQQRYLKYHAKNGYQLANNINNASMYHDAGDQNGHRANDLDRDFTQMGVGVSYNRRDRNYYIVIDFIG